MAASFPTIRLPAAASRPVLRNWIEPAAVGAVGAGYFFLFSWLAIRRHETYHSFGRDLGLFDQVFWNTVHGRPFESTMSLGLAQPHSFFSDHFSPLLWVIVPLYAVIPGPQTLLVVQTLALALGAWPVYLVARHRLSAGYERLLWVAVYFFFVPLTHINLFDFHEIVLAVPLLGFALYFIDRGDMTRFWFAFAAALLVKEEVALIGVGFAAYVILERKLWSHGTAIAATSVAWFAGVTALAIPFFGQGRSYAYFATRYSALGGSPLAVAHSLITSPLGVARLVVQHQKLAFLAALFGPVLAINLLSGWGLLLLLPTLAYLLLSNYAPQYSFTTQYSAPLIPLVVITAIWGFARLPTGWRRPVTGMMLISTAVFAFALGGLPGSLKFESHSFETEPRYHAFASELARIPPHARIASENNLTSHLSERRFIIALEFQSTATADYVALDYAGVGYDRRHFGQQIASFQAQGYQLVASGDGLALLSHAAGPGGIRPDTPSE